MIAMVDETATDEKTSAEVGFGGFALNGGPGASRPQLSAVISTVRALWA